MARHVQVNRSRLLQELRRPYLKPFREGKSLET
jgi:hypothetical protein